jgi:hypothetical protein
MRSNAKIHCQNFRVVLYRSGIWLKSFVQGLKLGFSLSKGLALVKVSKQHSIFYLIPNDQ